MRSNVNPTATVVQKTDTSAGGAAATITLAATEGVRHVVDMVWGGYNADPTGGAIQITATVGGTAVTTHVPVIGDVSVPVVLPFPQPLQGDVNTAITIVAAAGGGAVVAYINALTR